MPVYHQSKKQKINFITQLQKIWVSIALALYLTSVFAFNATDYVKAPVQVEIDRDVTNSNLLVTDSTDIYTLSKKPSLEKQCDAISLNFATTTTTKTVTSAANPTNNSPNTFQNCWRAALQEHLHSFWELEFI
jgi:hypothetical protein